MPSIRPISGKRLRRMFERAGFKHMRTEGDHFILTKPGIQRPLVIPDYNFVPVFIIRNNMRIAGMSRDEYFRLLDKL
jgi:predicted RNA binding protein YcfA (HicA-like mRNA interferase family)